MGEGGDEVGSKAAKAKKLVLKYYCTFGAATESQSIGETQAGYRIDIKYIRSKNVLKTSASDYDRDWTQGVKPPFNKYEEIQSARKNADRGAELQSLRDSGKLEWFGIEGACLSGGDWALVRSDAVALFDGRVTLEADDGFIFDMLLRGQVDLRGARTLDEAPAWFQALRNGATIDGPFPIHLAANFEGAQSEASWTPKDVRERAKHHWKYARLMRGQFIAVGSALFGSEAGTPLRRIDVDIFELLPAKN
jgi:hypothetical protein